ncbi:hypothetical protein QE152_g40479 [Popillia japonica]|uniref:Uncharacterized protein n=1 Tax=Popillia japonica TaxID=7064 RepID=A0AAW1HG82_POPJA
MKGQYSSHISDNTEEEQILPSKRKIFKRILDEYDYDEDELPPTQKVNSNSQQQECTFKVPIPVTSTFSEGCMKNKINSNSQQQECTFKVPIPVTSTFSEGCMKNKNYGVNNTDREIKNLVYLISNLKIKNIAEWSIKVESKTCSL